jgi:oligopeptide/dipeptide ABC transporter ATP-binding protein
VEYICDRVAVMYLGKIVEMGTYEQIYNHPKHPYTEALLSAVPIPDPKVTRRRILLQGDVPSPIHPPAGCHFHPRCPKRMDICDKERPPLTSLAGEHQVRCFLHA